MSKKVLDKVKTGVELTGDTSDLNLSKIPVNSFAPKLKKKFKLPNISPAL